MSITDLQFSLSTLKKRKLAFCTTSRIDTETMHPSFFMLQSNYCIWNLLVKAVCCLRTTSVFNVLSLSWEPLWRNRFFTLRLWRRCEKAEGVSNYMISVQHLDFQHASAVVINVRKKNHGTSLSNTETSAVNLGYCCHPLYQTSRRGRPPSSTPLHWPIRIYNDQPYLLLAAVWTRIHYG